MTVFVRVVRAHEGETVEIQWRLQDNTMFCQRVSLPPKATPEARQLSEQLVRELEAAAGVKELRKSGDAE